MAEKLTDNSIMWFGIHKGKTLANVPSLYLWNLYDSGKAFGNLKDYIVDNLDSIKSDLKK